MPHSSADWSSGVAEQVCTLVRDARTLARFRAQCLVFREEQRHDEVRLADWDRRRREHCERGLHTLAELKARTEETERLGDDRDAIERTRPPEDTEKVWVFDYYQEVLAPDELDRLGSPGNGPMTIAFRVWVPPELSLSARPVLKVPPLFGRFTDCLHSPRFGTFIRPSVASLAEKYASLVAIHDARFPDRDPIDDLNHINEGRFTKELRRRERECLRETVRTLPDTAKVSVDEWLKDVAADVARTLADEPARPEQQLKEGTGDMIPRIGLGERPTLVSLIGQGLLHEMKEIRESREVENAYRILAERFRKEVRRLNGLEYVRNKVRFWARDLLRRQREHDNWVEHRRDYEARLRGNPEWQDCTQAPPEDGWEFTRFAGPLFGWAPAHLHHEVEPDDSYPIRLPKRPLRPEEKHAVMSALHDHLLTEGLERIGRFATDTDEGGPSIVEKVTAYVETGATKYGELMMQVPLLRGVDLPRIDEYLDYVLEELSNELEPHEGPTARGPLPTSVPDSDSEVRSVTPAGEWSAPMAHVETPIEPLSTGAATVPSEDTVPPPGSVTDRVDQPLVSFPNPSAPMSKKDVADAWGGDMTVKKLSRLMASGKVRYAELNRETFMFCRDDVPSLPAR